MGMSRDIADEFINEVRLIEAELKKVIEELQKSKFQNKTLFEKFGQVIDRVYGTAATIGLKEIGDYAKAIKEISYKCSQSDNEKGIAKTGLLLEECVKYMDVICKSIHNPEGIKKVRLNLGIEVAKADRICRSYFFSVQRDSCKKELSIG